MSLWDMLSSKRFSIPANRSPERRERELFWRKSFWRLADSLKMEGGRAARLLLEMSSREREGRPLRELSERTDRRLPENIYP